MNIFGKFTLRNLQKNKTRTLVTMIGILLSTAMFTAVTTTVSSLQRYLADYNVYVDGNWYGAGYSLTSEEAFSLSNAEEVADSVTLGTVGYAYLDDSSNSYKPYLYVASMSEGFSDQMPVHITEGRLPENPTEIILPQHLQANGGISYQLGDVLDVAIGTRTWEGTTLNNHLQFYVGEHMEDFREFSQDGSMILLGDETWTKSYDTTYTVVGFYERPSFEDYSAPGYTALTYGIESDHISSYDVYYTTKSGYEAVDFTEKQSFYPDNGELNYDLLRLYGYSDESSYNQVLYGLAAILIGIIMFGSISLIYNAFSISVSERTKQFGILSSIGATKKQLLNSVIYEALYLGIFAIPLGILSGLLGMGVTFHFVGDSLASLMYNAPGVELNLHPSIGALIIAAVIALVTILISAYLPARKALKQPVMDAIRQNNDIKIASRKVRTNPLITKIFGFEGMIAVKNYKRSKKKYRATVFSLFISVVLFITASSFCEYLTRSVGVVYEEVTYDLEVSFYDTFELAGNTEEFLEGMKNCEKITDASYCTTIHTEIFMPRDSFTKEAQEFFDSYAPKEDKGKAEQLIYGVNCIFVEDEKFQEILSVNKIKEKDFYASEEPTGLLYNQQSGWFGDEARYKVFSVLASAKDCEIDLLLPLKNEDMSYAGAGYQNGEYIMTYEPLEEGDFIELLLSNHSEQKTVTCYSSIKKLPDLVYVTSSPCLYFPYSSLSEVFDVTSEKYSNGYFKDHSMIQFVADSSDSEASMTSLSAYREQFDWMEGGYYSTMDYASEMEMERTTVFIVRVFSYGFIILISLISVANVFNTISTNLMLRRKEFAMLRSVGMTPKGFSRMMNFECMLYGIKGLLYGLPVSIALTYLIYTVIQNGVRMNFFIPVSSILIAVGSVFLVVFATMIYSMRKLNKENTVDALKNENM